MLGDHICHTDYGSDQKFKQKRQVLAHCELLVWTTDELPASAEAVTIVHVTTRRSGAAALDGTRLALREGADRVLSRPTSRHREVPSVVP